MLMHAPRKTGREASPYEVTISSIWHRCPSALAAGASHITWTGRYDHDLTGR